MRFDWFPIAQASGSREIVDKLARTPLSQIVIFVFVLTLLRMVLYPYLTKTETHKRTGLYKLGVFGTEMLDAFIYAGVFVFMVIRPFGVQALLIPTGSMWPQLGVNDFIVANKAIYRYTNPKIDDIVVFHPTRLAALKPDDLDSDGEMKFDFVKRCVGLPGDLVEMRKGIMYRNGQKVEEPFQAYSECTDADASHCQNYRMMSADDRKMLRPPSFKLVNYKGHIIPLNYSNIDANARMPIVASEAEAKVAYAVAKEFQIDDPVEQKKAVALPAERIPKGYYLMMGDNRNNSYDGRAWGLVKRDQIVGRSEFVWMPISHIHQTR